MSTRSTSSERTTTLADLLLSSAEFEAFMAWAAKIRVTVEDAEPIPVPEVAESDFATFRAAQK
jgi:hypothetical protein